MDALRLKRLQRDLEVSKRLAYGMDVEESEYVKARRDKNKQRDLIQKVLEQGFEGNGIPITSDSTKPLSENGRMLYSILKSKRKGGNLHDDRTNFSAFKILDPSSKNSTSGHSSNLNKQDPYSNKETMNLEKQRSLSVGSSKKSHMLRNNVERFYNFERERNNSRVN
jgi:hypothetical protein